MQMPGLSSSPLAQRLRELACNARLLAMSGSPCSEDATRGFDGFLLKPFSMEALGSAISSEDRSESQSGEDTPAFSSAVVLDETVYRKLSAAMSTTKLTQLYSLCLDDVAGRVTKMRAAAESGDDETYRREAHAIKGGCGLVGAVELQTIATSEENTGIHANHVATLDEFLNASERLQRMLIAHQHHLNDSTVVTETRSNA
jgi:HPt (histidine-containing phosphotransfer) domain-containing protein